MSPVAVNGVLHADDEASVSVFDHGFTTGDGIFETILLRRNRPFALSRHLLRLERSAAGMNLLLPGRDEVMASVEAVLAATPPPASGLARLRITVTGGPAPPGSAREGGEPTLIVSTWPISPQPATAAVVTTSWTRNERSAVAGLKTTSYAENVVALDYARRHGATEAIFSNCAGNLCEATASNVFVVVEGELVTPPLSAGILAGVTRDLVLESAEVEAIERDVAYDRIVSRRIDEAFLTSTTRGVQAIAAIDGVELPGVPGPITSRAREALESLMAGTDEP